MASLGGFNSIEDAANAFLTLRNDIENVDDDSKIPTLISKTEELMSKTKAMIHKEVSEQNNNDRNLACIVKSFTQLLLLLECSNKDQDCKGVRFDVIATGRTIAERLLGKKQADLKCKNELLQNTAMPAKSSLKPVSILPFDSPEDAAYAYKKFRRKINKEPSKEDLPKLMAEASELSKKTENTKQFKNAPLSLMTPSDKNLNTMATAFYQLYFLLESELKDTTDPVDLSALEVADQIAHELLNPPYEETVEESSSSTSTSASSSAAATPPITPPLTPPLPPPTLSAVPITNGVPEFDKINIGTPISSTTSSHLPTMTPSPEMAASPPIATGSPAVTTVAATTSAAATASKVTTANG